METNKIWQSPNYENFIYVPSFYVLSCFLTCSHMTWNRALPGVAGGRLWDLCLGPFNRINFYTVKVTKDRAHRNYNVFLWISINQHRIYMVFQWNSSEESTNKKRPEKNKSWHKLFYTCFLLQRGGDTITRQQILHWALSPRTRKAGNQETTFEGSIPNPRCFILGTNSELYINI